MIGKPKKIKPGDELTTTWLNQLLVWCQENTINLGVSSGLLMNRSQLTGTTLAVANKPRGQLAKTDGVITARSGTTVGEGDCFFCDIETDGVTIGVGTSPVFVYNFSSTTGGIATATFVWLQQDDYGNWWITAVDCGN